jgi:hypothetical protein
MYLTSVELGDQKAYVIHHIIMSAGCRLVRQIVPQKYLSKKGVTFSFALHTTLQHKALTRLAAKTTVGQIVVVRSQRT